MTVVGFAVAGGRSRRMGEDKALLPWGNTDLLGHTLRRLRNVTDDVRILPGAARRYGDRGLDLVVDARPDRGPLGGLLAALESAEGRGVLFLGVDLPLASVPLLRHLAEGLDRYDAAVPVTPAGPEPLCAAYGAACLVPVRRCVSAGDLKMTAFWPNVRVREVAPEELEPFGNPVELFMNVNSPESYERARLARR